jgi:hypothetical protein
MAHTNNIPINPAARLRFEAALRFTVRRSPYISRPLTLA